MYIVSNKISQLKLIRTQIMTDVIGIVYNDQGWVEINTSSGFTKQKRTITIIDDSHDEELGENEVYGIDLTFWSNEPKEYDIEENQAIIVTNVGLREFRNAN